MNVPEPSCRRCASPHGLRFVVVYLHYGKQEQFWLCQSCTVELVRFAFGEPMPVAGDLDPARGFEIERGSDGRKENPPTPQT